MTDDDIWRLQAAAGTTTARCTRPTRPPWSTPASRRSSWPRPSRATALGPHFAGRNATHQMKKLTLEDLKLFRDRLQIPITDAAARGRPLPAAVLPPRRRSDEVIQLPARAPRAARRADPAAPGDGQHRSSCRTTRPTRRSAAGSGKQQVATTMAFVRLLRDLMRDKEFGPRVVPIIPDEARTFGMDSFFPTAKIYNPHGQQYTSVDRELMLAYKESTSRPDPARRDQRGRLGGRVHRGGLLLRHARRADGADLHLLLDVRFPAHRRRDVGGRRPDGPRLPARRHGRAAPR